jgi:K319L-like, PKD domain/Bacterial Ig-like domain (group 2)
MKPAARTIGVCIGLVLIVAADASAMTIVAPAAGTTVAAGATVIVRISAAPTEQLANVAVTAGGQPVSATPIIGLTTFEATVTVPQNSVGPAHIVALGTATTGRTAMDFIPVTVDAGTLKSLIVTAPTTLTSIGQVFPIKVTGLFVDGVLRDLTLPERGTTYTSSDPTIAAVHSSGLVQARRKGYADVIVTSRGITTRHEITVAVPDPPDNGIPVPNPGPDQTVASQSIVTLSAAASHDPDGDSITYTWSQVDGRLVTLTAINAVDLRFTAPRVTTPQTLTFSLVVRDQKGAASLPTTVRVVVQP